MGKNREFDDLELDEYEDYFDDIEIDDESLIASSEDFEENAATEFSMDKDNKSSFDVMLMFQIFSTWFIRIGIVLAIGLLIMFFVTGEVLKAFLYIFGLLLSFSIGYVLMYCLDHFILEQRNKLD